MNFNHYKWNFKLSEPDEVASYFCDMSPRITMNERTKEDSSEQDGRRYENIYLRYMIKLAIIPLSELTGTKKTPRS